jgi:hypothetical protein
MPCRYEMDPQIGVNNKTFTGMERDSATEGGLNHTRSASATPRWAAG